MPLEGETLLELHQLHIVPRPGKQNMDHTKIFSRQIHNACRDMYMQ